MYQLSATQLRDLFLAGDVSAQEIASYFLKRIEQHNPATGAFLSILTARVLNQAERLDQKKARKEQIGKLAGIPVAIKDNMHIQGELTTAGSKFLKNYKAPFSSSVVSFLEQEDALLIGKTNLDEFAMGSSNENSAFFPSKNPWHLSCVPGGSSGGSASAIASRLALIATGTDTGGSIRQPAGFCGIVGYKPTYGRVSRYGMIAFGSSLDQIGPMTTNVSDAALTMEVIGRHCPHDAMCLDFPQEGYLLKKDLKGVKLGVPVHFLDNLSPEMKTHFEECLKTFQNLGAEWIELDLDILKYSIAVYYILATAEASTNLARFDGVRYGVRSNLSDTLESLYESSRKEGFGKEVKNRIMLGTYVLSSGYQEAYYKKAQKVRALILQAFEKAFETCDAIVMPVSPSGAFRSGAIHDPVEMYLQDVFTIPANLAGLPAISIPSGKDSRGMPLGLQILGPQMCDTAVMQYAYAYEQASSFQPGIPPLFDQEVL